MGLDGFTRCFQSDCEGTSKIMSDQVNSINSKIIHEFVALEACAFPKRRRNYLVDSQWYLVNVEWDIKTVNPYEKVVNAQSWVLLSPDPTLKLKSMIVLLKLPIDLDDTKRDCRNNETYILKVSEERNP